MDIIVVWTLSDDDVRFLDTYIADEGNKETRTQLVARLGLKSLQNQITLLRALRESVKFSQIQQHYEAIPGKIRADLETAVKIEVDREIAEAAASPNENNGI